MKNLSSVFFNILLWISIVSVYAETPEQTINKQSTNSVTIFYEEEGKTRAISHPLDSVSSITFEEINPSSNGDMLPDNIVCTLKSGKEKKLALEKYKNIDFSPNIPEIRIVTEPYIYDVKDKVDWHNAKIIFRDYSGKYPNLDSTEFQLRGRGNTTLNYDKKPYRLKFAKKTSIAGLKKAKNYCLIANFVDKTLLHNVVAFKLAQMLNMPYTNNIIPCNVWLNERYCGSYFLTEKIGTNSTSVDIDEQTGILWELDTYFDEDYKFKSPVNNLPVMVKDPDLNDIALELTEILEGGDTETIANHPLLSRLNLENKTSVTGNDIFEFWKNDFNSLEQAVEQGNLSEVINMEDLVNYILVYHVLLNRELQYPKSNYIYKATPDDKFHFGPVWDFDWSGPLYGPANYRLFGKQYTGEFFYQKIIRNPEFLEEFGKKWEYFYQNLFQDLLDYIDEYAQTIRISAYQNGELYTSEKTNIELEYGSSETFDENIKEFKNWLSTRVKLINSFKSSTYLFYFRNE